MEDPARMPGEPGPHFQVLVRAIVVQNRVDQFDRRHSRLDSVEEAQGLLVAVTLHASPDHGVLQYVERGKQRRGAVADVVVGPGLEATWRDARRKRVRSRAWIWLFSSRESTTAWRGGAI